MASRRKRNLQFLPAEPRATAALDINALPIDIGVGELMRLTRERLGQELQTVANQLRIRLGYLEAIEDGRFRDLPGSTYAVGFVRSYADYLGLDSADIVRRFREEAARIHGTTKLIFPSLSAEGKVPRAAVLFLSAIGLAVAYGAWYYMSSRNSVELPLIGEVPDRLVALPPDEGATPAAPAAPQVTPQAETSPPADATPPSTNAAPAPSTSTGSAIAAPAVEPPAAPSVAPPVLPPAAPPSPAPTTSASATPSITGSANAATPDEEDVPPAPETAPTAESAPPATGAPAISALGSGAATGNSASPPAATVDIPPAVDSSNSVAVPPAAPTESSGIPAAPAAPTVESAPPAQEAALPAGASKGIVLEARIDSWIQVVNSSGKVVFSQILRPGERYVVPDEPGLTLDTGNAGGLDILVDGTKAPPLGDVGSVRHRVAMDAARLLGGTATGN